MGYRSLGESEVAWAGKTASEIRAIGERDGSVVVVPMGSIEQHGDHLPVATDTILVDAVAQHGAERASDEVPVLVTPTEWVGSSPHHMPLGGTITGGYETLLDLLGEIIDATVQNGFDAACIVNGHGGNEALVESVPRMIGPDHYPSVDIRACTYFRLPEREAIDEIRASDPGGMGHAGEFETALMMHLRPELVDETSFQGSGGGSDMFDPPSPVSGYGEFGRGDESGVSGEPHLATAAAGEAFFDVVTDRFASLLRDMHHRNS